MYSTINLINLSNETISKRRGNKMDLFKKLIQLNNEIELNKLAEERYEVETDDEEEEIYFSLDTRGNFIRKYNKTNNIQFKIKKQI